MKRVWHQQNVFSSLGVLYVVCYLIFVAAHVVLLWNACEGCSKLSTIAIDKKEWTASFGCRYLPSYGPGFFTRWLSHDILRKLADRFFHRRHSTITPCVSPIATSFPSLPTLRSLSNLGTSFAGIGSEPGIGIKTLDFGVCICDVHLAVPYFFYPDSRVSR